MHRHHKRNGKWFLKGVLYFLGRIALICLMLVVAMVLIVGGILLAVQLFIYYIEHST